MELDELKNDYPDLVYLGNTPDEFKDAIVVVSTGNGPERVIYDYSKLVKCFISQGMTEEEAEEWIGCNTLRSLPYCGEHAPIVMLPVGC